MSRTPVQTQHIGPADAANSTSPSDECKDKENGKHVDDKRKENGKPKDRSEKDREKSLLVSKPTLVEYKSCRFLIMDAPTDSNLPLYIEVLLKKHVVAVVRACEPSYITEPLLKANIKVVEMPFPDGDPPPTEVITKWLEIVQNTFQGDNPNKSTIAVHCVAGLGRAPILVAIALVEAGMEPFDAVKFIRKKRKGAFNHRQLNFIEAYKPRRASNRSSCIIS